MIWLRLQRLPLVHRTWFFHVSTPLLFTVCGFKVSPRYVKMFAKMICVTRQNITCNCFYTPKTYIVQHIKAVYAVILFESIFVCGFCIAIKMQMVAGLDLAERDHGAWECRTIFPQRNGLKMISPCCCRRRALFPHTVLTLKIHESIPFGYFGGMVHENELIHFAGTDSSL